MWIVNNTHLRNCYIFFRNVTYQLKNAARNCFSTYLSVLRYMRQSHIKFGFIWTSWYLKITVTISWDPREYGGKSDIHVVYMCYAYCICVIYMHIYVYIHTYTSDTHVDRKKSLLLKILLFDKFNSSDCCAKTFAGGLPTVSPRLLLWFSVIQSHKWSLYYTSISIPWSPCPSDFVVHFTSGMLSLQ